MTGVQTCALPISLLPVASNVFGWFNSAIFNIMGWFLGSVIVFYISRKYGVPLIKKFVSLEKINKLESKIPKENLLGQDGRGFIRAMKTLDAGRLGLGAATLGSAKELLEMSTQFAKQRKQFQQAISHFQAVQFMLAEMATMIYNMESIVYRAAVDYQLGKKISLQAAIVKYYCSESLNKIADYAMQIHGGMGFSKELPIERFYRDARINSIFEGTNEIQKAIIAHDLIKKNGVWK